MGIALLLATFLFAFNYYIAVIPAPRYSTSLSQGLGYSGLYVGVAAVGGLLSVGAQRQWVKSSYFKPLWFSIAFMALGNGLLLLTFNAHSQSFSLLARMLIGAGTPMFPTRFYIGSVIVSDERDEWRRHYWLALTLGTCSAFVASGWMTSIVGNVLFVDSTVVPCLIACFIDVSVLLAVLIHLIDEKPPSIPVPIIRTQPDQHRVAVALSAMTLPHLLWECSMILCPLVMEDQFAQGPLWTALLLVIAAVAQLPCYYVHDKLKTTAAETNWVFLGLVGGLVITVAGILALTQEETYWVLVIASSPVFVLSHSSSYQILRSEQPFSEKGSWWNSEFTLVVVSQLNQLFGGLWAALILALGVGYISFTFFLPAVVLFTVALAIVAMLADRWPLISNPFS